ncbi:FixH family protein [Aminobacter sp. HY435]|uniref:FixH family protein n=1 Tax=Aminobacter sp. HY435 TaxID=2970917 RepID=UPI0022B9471A|nr:FixH family protein [Aminobacter sp. HY435]
MNARSMRPRQFTGWHMLAIVCAFFGTIITVNLIMATYANTSWTGLVVQNTYVASNERIAESRAQAALGWKDELAIANGEIRYTLVDASGAAIPVANVSASFRRPAYEAEDWQATLERTADGAFATKAAIRDGIWIVNTEARLDSGQVYHQARRIVVSNGTLK